MAISIYSHFENICPALLPRESSRTSYLQKLQWLRSRDVWLVTPSPEQINTYTKDWDDRAYDTEGYGKMSR